MRIRWTIRIATAAGLLTLAAGVAAGGGTARAAARPTTPAAPGATTAAGATTAGYLAGGQLNGVAATSAGNAWAVGATGPIGRPSTLLLHWNGKAWARAAGVKPVAGSLAGLAPGVAGRAGGGRGQAGGGPAAGDRRRLGDQRLGGRLHRLAESGQARAHTADALERQVLDDRDHPEAGGGRLLRGQRR